jgi:hypothetical protein
MSSLTLLVVPTIVPVLQVRIHSFLCFHSISFPNISQDQGEIFVFGHGPAFGISQAIVSAPLSIAKNPEVCHCIIFVFISCC